MCQQLFDCKVERPVCIETTSLGAAYLAGLATGFWKSKGDVIQNWQIDRVFEPHMDETERKEKLKGWEKAVDRVRDWAK